MMIGSLDNLIIVLILRRCGMRRVREISARSLKENFRTSPVSVLDGMRS